MSDRYLDLLVTPSVRRAQQRAYGVSHVSRGATDPAARDALGPDEIAFVAARDSFYLASVSESGWPYVQHRGGPPGFLRVLDVRTLAFADLRGNRQLLTAGNVAADPRVSLFLMDYPGRRRLKILGRAAFVDATADPDLADRAPLPAGQPRADRIVRIDVVAFDWNCPKHITQRFTAAEVRSVVTPLQDRVRALEARLRAAGLDPAS